MPVSLCEDTIDDIEDLMNTGDILSNDHFHLKKDVVPKVRRKKAKRQSNKDQCRIEELRTDSIVPG